LDNLTQFTQRLPLFADRPALRYGATILLYLLALAARFGADSLFPSGYPFVSFFPAVILSAFLFGARPGVLASVLCGLSAWYFFIFPRYTFATDSPTIMAMLFFWGVCCIDITLVHLMQRANGTLHATQEDVRALADERGQLVERAQVLFQELQHRVGNNLQMVGAVLSLQMRNLAEPSAKKALADAAARLQVIGNIQRQLYRHDGALVPLDVFLEEVSSKVMASSSHAGIRCQVDADEGIVMRPDSAVPMALILSEAIANALEHGFAGRDEGLIAVRVERSQEEIVLTVTDDGAGLPPGFDAASTDSIGLRISRVLSQQLGARHAIETQECGARMTLRVPSSRLAENA